MEKIINHNPRYQNNKVTENTFGKLLKLFKDFKIDTIFVKTINFIYRNIANTVLINKRFITHKLLLKDKYFKFQNKVYKYFIKKYNTTWNNERKVEIAIIKDYLQMYNSSKILEVGNVLSHYFHVKHTIVDKFEIYKNVINEDILTFSPNVQYDLIISISTIEHIGWDDTEQNSDKIIQVVEKLNKLKSENGKVLITAPLGYNPNLDNMLKENKLPFNKILCLKRISEQGKWIEVDFDKKETFEYGSPYPCANTIFIGFI